MSAPFVLAAIALATITTAMTARSRDDARARRWAGLGSALTLGFALVASFRDRSADAPTGFDETLPSFGLDGLSAPLFPLVAGLVLAIVLGAPARFAARATLARIVATGALFLGLLGARAPIVVALFWVLSSLPTILELRGRSGGRVFFVHRVASTVLVASGVLLATTSHTTLAGSLVVLGVMVREGIFPFHAWVPRLYERAPLGTALVFLQPQIGAYVLARFVITGPLASASLLLDVLGVITVLYAAALALGQRSGRRALGYLAVSQSALVLVGLADGGLLGATGAILVIVSVGLAQTGFGLALWATEARRGELVLDADGGGHASTPALAGATLVLGLASVGLPGTLAFVAEDLVFHATLEARPWVGIAMVIATALNGISVLRIVFRLFGGRARKTGERDLTPRERVVLGLVGATLVLFGLLPHPLLAPAHDALERLDVHGLEAGPPSRRSEAH